MNHEQMKDEVMAYFDGQLRGERKSVAGVHLRECTECRSLETFWGKASALLKVENPAGSERFVSAVMGRIDADEDRWAGLFSGVFSRWFAPLAAGIAFAGFVALLVVPAAESPVATDTVLSSEVEDQMPASWLSPGGVSQDHAIDVVSEEI